MVDRGDARDLGGSERVLRERDQVVGIEDDVDLLGARPALDEALSHRLRAGDDMVSESDARLLACHQHLDHQPVRRHSVLGHEELGHALHEIEEHPSAKQLRDDGREDQAVRQ